MAKQVIMCDVCYRLGGSNIFPLSQESPTDEVNTHVQLHEQQLLTVSGQKVSVKVEKKNASDMAKPTAATVQRRRGRPPGKQLANGDAPERTKQPSKAKEPKPKVPKPPRPPRPPPEQPLPPPPYTDLVDRHCHDLLKARREGKSIQCAECGGFLTIVHRGDEIEVKYAIQHVYKHLGAQVFLCNLCEVTASTDSIIKKHLVTVHSLSGSQKNYKITSSKPEADVIAKLTGCFGKPYEKRE